MQEVEGFYSLHYSFPASTTNIQGFLRQGSREASVLGITSPRWKQPFPFSSFSQPPPTPGPIPARRAPTIWW